LLSISQNQALFALLGTQYGGDGRTTFALPDLRSRVAVHVGTGFVQGQQTGAESVTLTASTMPSHSHGFRAVTDTADKKVPTGHLMGTDTSQGTDFLAPPGALVALNSQSTSMTGNNLPHENRQPYLALNYCIALNGIFPTRN
jgi:microcystin-dependent protein